MLDFALASLPRACVPVRLTLLVTLIALLLAACGSAPRRDTAPSPASSSPSAVPLSPKYYKDDGPGENPPANLDAIPDAVAKPEPLHRFANRPYTVLGRDYVPAT